jgi:ABC-2 type transport system ATP-binding protein
MEQPSPVIDFENVTFSFKQHRALEGLTFQVWPGALHGFVGPNGAGKTTTLKLICTLLRPQIGRLEVFGHDVREDLAAVRRRLGYMPDHFSLYRQMTVHEYLDFFAAAYGLPLAERDRVIDDVLSLTDLNGRRDDVIQGLSRGMQQRVSLARVLVHDPDLLLLDEPASGLDPRARIELMEILRELRRLGKTIFISSHILSELAELCDSVTIIDLGRVRYSGSMDALLKRQTAESTYRLTIDGDPAPVAAALRPLPGITAISVGDAPVSLRIRCAPPPGGLDANALLQRVLDLGVRVVSFGPDHRQLNDAFMALTHAGVRD